MNTLKGLLERLTASLSLRERRALGITLVVVCAGIIWLVLIAPAWQQISKAPQAQQVLDTQLQKMRLEAQEAAQLRADTAAIDGDAAKFIQEATKTHLGAGSQVVFNGENATVTLVAVSPNGLAQWLATVRQNARSKPTEARLTQSGAVWGGTIQLALPPRARQP